MPYAVPAVGASASDRPMEKMEILRRDVGPSDVRIKIEYCGICHSDIHTARNEWKGSQYPVVPGHEIIGIVTEVGAEVTTFGAGDRVGIGCIVDSCGECAECGSGLQNYCTAGAVFTYNSSDPHSTEDHTFGGYSGEIVVTASFVLKVPDDLDPASAAPILCAGATLFSPLRHWDIGPGTKLAVVGFGGLGAMGVKLAVAMGAEVTVISRSDTKKEVALKAGAAHYLESTDAVAMAAANRTFDAVISTIPKTHDMEPYLDLIKTDGTYIIVGAIEPMTEPWHSGKILRRRLSIAGSNIAGIRETQEALDFCAEHGIVSDIEIIPAAGINDAYEQIAKGDPGYRYVIDMSTL